MTRSKAVAAHYREVEIVDYRGNPLIEALPAINSPAMTSEILQLKPLFDVAERQQPPWIRSHYLKRLRKIVLPLPSFFAFESQVSRNIRSGYAARHPLSPETQALRYAAGKPGAWYDASLDPYSASELTVVGLSGMGKSTMVEAVLRSYPQYIRHTVYNGARFVANQIVWLKINCPHNGSLSALCRSFFEAVDRATGTTKYGLKYSDPKLTIDTLIGGMRQVAATYYLGVLIIDELQNLSVAKAGGAELMMNYFMNLRTEIRTPLILVGTYKAVSLFGREMRFARRASENGLTDLIKPTDHTDPVWRNLVRTLWEYQWLRKPSELDEGIHNELFDCSQGVTEILVALFSSAQEVAISDDDGEEFGSITKDLIRECYDSAFVLLHPSIDALRSNSVRNLQIFEDLLPPGGISESIGAASSGRPEPEEKEQAADRNPSLASDSAKSEPSPSPGERATDDDDDVRKPEGLQRALDKKGKIPGAPM